MSSWPARSWMNSSGSSWVIRNDCWSRKPPARWEAERQAFLSRIEGLQAHIRDVERATRDEQARSEAALLGWQERLDSARTRFDEDRQAFEEEIRRLRLENETGGRELESAIRQADTARQELTQSRSEIAGLLESADHARQLYEAACRRNDELDLQVSNLREELERLQRDHEAELREHPRHPSDAGEEPAVERLSTAPAPPDHAAMLDRSAGDQEGLRTTLGHDDGLATEAKVLRDPDPLPVPHGDVISGHGNDLETARRQIEELTEQLQKARGANAQLSSILDVVGLIIHPVKEGTGLIVSRCEQTLRRDEADLAVISIRERLHPVADSSWCRLPQGRQAMPSRVARTIAAMPARIALGISGHRSTIDLNRDRRALCTDHSLSGRKIGSRSSCVCLGLREGRFGFLIRNA